MTEPPRRSAPGLLPLLYLPTALAGLLAAARRAGPDCTLCGDCLATCAQQAIGYHFPGLYPHQARAIFLALILGIHAAFLGLARI